MKDILGPIIGLVCPFLQFYLNFQAESEPVPEKKKPGPKKKEKVADKEMTPTASASTASAKKDSSRAGTPSSVKGLRYFLVHKLSEKWLKMAHNTTLKLVEK